MDRDLAKRAVACKGWRWLPGMLAVHPNWRGFRVSIITVAVAQDSVAVLPDLTDPATLGALLALVRGAYGDQEAFVRPDGSGSWVFCTLDPMAPRVMAPNETWCLVAALEAAP